MEPAALEPAAGRVAAAGMELAAFESAVGYIYIYICFLLLFILNCGRTQD